MTIASRFSKFGRSIKEHPWRFLRRILYVIVGSFLAYLLIINVALQTNVLRGQLSLPPTEVTLEYTRGYSIFPGRVHVEGLRLRGQDSQIQWELKVDRADFWLSLTDLPKKLFHAKNVRADGVAFRVRLRVEASTHPSAEHFAALPPIEGYADPPMKDPPPAVKEPTDVSKIWSVQLDDVDAMHVRETWVDAMREAGDMHILGRWYFRPTQFIDLGPVSVAATKVDVSYGKIPIATGMTGTVAVKISPMEIQEAGGREFLQHITGTVDVEGLAHTMEALQVFILPKGTTGTGTAPMKLNLVFNQGKLANGTTIELAKAPLEAKLGPMHLKVEPQLSLEVKRDDTGKDVGHARVEASAIQFSYGDTSSQATRATVSTTSQTLDFCALPFSQLTLDAAVTDAELTHHDLHAAIKKVTIKSPALVMDYDALTAAGTVNISSSGISAPLGKETLSGSLSAKVTAKADNGDTNFTGTSIAFDGNMTPKNQPWWARIEISAASVHAQLPQTLRLHAQVRAKDVTPATALLASITGVPRWLLDAAPLDDLVAHGDVHLGPDLAELRKVSAKGGAQALQFEYKEHAKTTEWLLMADAGPLRVGVHSSRLGTDIRLLDVESWFLKIQQNMKGATPLR